MKSAAFIVFILATASANAAVITLPEKLAIGIASSTGHEEFQRPVVSCSTGDGTSNAYEAPRPDLFEWTIGCAAVRFQLSHEIAFESSSMASAVPEPSTWALLLAGFAGLAIIPLRRTKKMSQILRALNWDD